MTTDDKMPQANAQFLRLALARMATSDEAADSDTQDAVEPARTVKLPGRPPQLVIPYHHFEFKLDNVDDATCEAQISFTKAEICQILPYMRLDLCTFSFRCNPSAKLAFCIFLANISYPNRWKDRMNFFGRSRSFISTVFDDVVTHISTRFRDFMLWDGHRLSVETLCRYCAVIEEENIWRFIDGTALKISRDMEN